MFNIELNLIDSFTAAQFFSPIVPTIKLNLFDICIYSWFNIEPFNISLKNVCWFDDYNFIISFKSNQDRDKQIRV